MIIINENKLISNSKQKESLNYFKDKSNNDYCIDNAWRLHQSDDYIFIDFSFKIDNIRYRRTFNTLKTSSASY